MELEQKRARHRRFWEPLTRGEGAYLAVTSPLQGAGSDEEHRLADARRSVAGGRRHDERL